MARYNVDPIQEFIDIWPAMNQKERALAEIALLGELALRYEFTVVDHKTYDLLADCYRENYKE